jgi:alpha-tubulin suppressor-like RCC1 family protein
MGSFGGQSLGNPGEFVPIAGIVLGTEIACGDQHCCTNLNDGVSCWGSNSRGQLGEGFGASPFTAAIALDERMVQKLAVGANHSCALVDTEPGPGASVMCWGDNQYGQLGSWLENMSQSLIDIFSTQQLLTMGSGGNSGCVTQLIDQTTSSMCWGDNQFGQLGVDPGVDGVLPPGDFFEVQLRPEVPPAINNSTACFIDVDSNVLCRGSNVHGIVDPSGVGMDRRNAWELSPVLLPVRAFKVQLGGSSACIIGEMGVDPTVYCWGDASHGRLGEVSQSNEIFLPQ